MATKKKKKENAGPVERLRSFPLQAAIWRNETENRVFHSVTFSRSYKEGKEYRNVDSFSGAQLLQLAHLAQQAYDRCDELDNEANGFGESEADQDETEEEGA
ncbi:hypothetical protein [Hyphomicrobium sp. MC8b]|uniref:hypothetical protein n=1 Tax=Hyphomicrobium sp. MC8b TaxID=300273 RepID=UPI00391CB5A4